MSWFGGASKAYAQIVLLFDKIDGLAKDVEKNAENISENRSMLFELRGLVANSPTFEIQRQLTESMQRIAVLEERLRQLESQQAKQPERPFDKRLKDNSKIKSLPPE
ncbi:MULTISPECIES: hypothetical protein [unclassified Marinovum]